MKHMNLKTFLRQNRREIDDHIRAQGGYTGKLNDEDRHEWLLNDESLYVWAKECGVKL